jgi:hypothetical protein
MKRMTLFLLIAVLLSGCSTLYNNGKFENHLMRTPISDKHGTLERFEGTGIVVRTVGDNIAPEIIVGKYAHTQLFVPIMRCTTSYDETGKERSTTCDVIPSFTVEAQVAAQGGRIGDIIKTGDAVKYQSSYTAWIEALKNEIQKSNTDEATKSAYIHTLDKMLDTIQ